MRSISIISKNLLLILLNFYLKQYECSFFSLILFAYVNHIILLYTFMAFLKFEITSQSNVLCLQYLLLYVSLSKHLTKVISYVIYCYPISAHDNSKCKSNEKKIY